MSRLRQATRDDTAEIWRVRYAVTENRLTPGRIADAELHAYLEDFGRGWVVELAPGRIAGFAIGDARDGHIWALFVDPPLHGQGHGRTLHDAMVDWLFAQGHERLDLGTQPDSRAEAFYRRAGWQPTDDGLDAHGDKRFELHRKDWKSPMLETHEIETGASPRTTLIVLHGLGADGFDFVPICGELDLTALGPVRYVFPHAPQRPVTINGGYVMRAWYDILVTDLVRREDEAGLRESQAQIAALIDRERERGVAAERIVLLGFSQGCAMALMTALRYPHRLGGVVGLSGYVPLAATTAAERSDANAGLPIFLAHGTQDPIVPHARGLASRDALRALGHAVEGHDYPMPHSVCAEEIADINAWLLKQLG